MGVEPFLLSSSVIGVLAQRLVRVLCEHCKTAQTVTPKEQELLRLDTNEKPELYHPQGCENCNMTGYQGRTGIYELVSMDDSLRTMIHDGAGEHELENHARKTSPGIREDGRRKILEGLTTLEEVLRVTRED